VQAEHGILMTKSPLTLVSCGLIAFMAIAPATAKIVKTARTDCKTNRICLYWWPQLPAMPGWHTDSAVNYTLGENGAYVLIPDGSDFSNAGAIIYATATYKPSYSRSKPEIKTLDDFIADDKRAFQSENAGTITIADASPLTTGDGETLRSVTYFRPKAKNWDRVAFGEDADYYLTFTINARTLTDYDAAQKAFESLLKAYKQ
jgi:hypothetical protein